jgi:hypothetical protein
MKTLRSFETSVIVWRNKLEKFNLLHFRIDQRKRISDKQEPSDDFTAPIIIIIIIIIGKDTISFMQGIYTYIPETNPVPKQYNVAAILSLLFMVSISLAPALTLMYFYVSTFQTMCAVPNMAVFCSYLTSWFPGMVFTYFLNDFEMVPVTPIITGITLVFTLYCKVFIFQNLLSFFLNHIPVTWNCDIYQHTCSLFIIAYCIIWLVTGDGPVSLYLLVLPYGYLTPSTIFYWCWYIFIPVLLLLLLIIIFSGSAAQRGLWPPRSRGFLITHNDTPQAVGLLWTSDHLVAETSTWQHTTDKHPCPRWDSNPRSQLASGSKLTP